MAGLERAEQVFLNRVLTEYEKEQLPNPEQVRFDVARLVKLVAVLQIEVNKKTEVQ